MWTWYKKKLIQICAIYMSITVYIRKYIYMCVYVYVYEYVYYKFKSLVFDVIGLINFSRLVNKKNNNYRMHMHTYVHILLWDFISASYFITIFFFCVHCICVSVSLTIILLFKVSFLVFSKPKVKRKSISKENRKKNFQRNSFSFEACLCL